MPAACMKTIRYDQSDFAAALTGALAVNSLFDSQIEERVRAVINAVAERGDAAVLELTERFDKVKLTAGELTVTPPRTTGNATLRKAIGLANRNIAAFAQSGVDDAQCTRRARRREV